MSHWISLSLSLLLSSASLNLYLSQAQAQAVSEVAPTRLVVVPFRNLTPNSADDWLGESFSENLTMALSQSRQLELVERSQLELLMHEQGLGQSAYADENTAPQLGKLIGAQHMLLGSYQKQGSRILVNARLVEVETGRIVSGRMVQLEGDYERLFALQSQLAEQLLLKLYQPSGQQPRQLSAQRLEKSLKLSDSAGAYEKYLKGLNLARQQSDPLLRQAITLFEQAINEDPGFTLAYVALSEALSQRTASPFLYPSTQADDLTRALDYAEKALTRQDHPEAVYRALARAYSARGQLDQALSAIAESLRQQPGNTDSIMVYLDLEAQKLGDLSQLRSNLERFKADTEDPWVQFALAICYLKYYKQRRQTDLPAVKELLLKVRQQAPYFAFVPVKLAWVETLRQRYDLAYEHLQEALRLEPDNYMILYKAGLLMTSSPDHQAQAEKYLRRSIELLPDFGNSEAQLGVLFFSQQRLPEAQQYLQRARQHLPNGSLPLMYLGLIAERQGEDSKAYTYLLQATDNAGKVAHEPVERGRLRLHLARLADKLKRPQEAEQHASLALQELDVSPAEVYRSWIDLLLKRQAYSEARTRFGQYQASLSQQNLPLSDSDQRLYQKIYLSEQLQLKPNDPALLNDLGSLALLENQLTEAQDYLQRAAQQAPNQPAILFNLGLLQLRQNLFAAAQQSFEQVLKQDPAHRKAAYNLGLALKAQGQQAAARSIWEDLLKRYPGDHDSLKALEES